MSDPRIANARVVSPEIPVERHDDALVRGATVVEEDPHVAVGVPNRDLIQVTRILPVANTTLCGLRGSSRVETEGGACDAGIHNQDQILILIPNYNDWQVLKPLLVELDEALSN
jgi:hypothetical protein